MAITPKNSVIISWENENSVASIPSLSFYYSLNIEENKLVKVGLGNYIIELLLKCLKTRAA